MLGLVLTFIGCSAKSAGSDCTETCWVYVTSVIDAKTFNTSHGLMQLPRNVQPEHSERGQAEIECLKININNKNIKVQMINTNHNEVQKVQIMSERITC